MRCVGKAAASTTSSTTLAPLAPLASCDPPPPKINMKHAEKLEQFTVAVPLNACSILLRMTLDSRTLVSYSTSLMMLSCLSYARRLLCCFS